MKILMRLGKIPFESVSVEDSIKRNTIGNNSGNLLFQYSAYKMLYNGGCEIDSLGYKTSSIDHEYVNENYDALVLPLANAFRGSFVKQLNGYSELIEKLKIPVTVLSVGAQSTIGDFNKLNPLNDAVKRFCRAVLERSPSIGVRGEFTKSYLNELGFSDVEVIGCPSIFLNGDYVPSIEKKPLGKYSKIAINATEGLVSFGDVFRDNLIRYPKGEYFPQNIITLKKFMSDFVDNYDCNLEMGLPDSYEHLVYHHRKSNFFVDIPTWMQYMRSFDFVFGSRIHGNIIGLLSGVPAHVIAHDSRTLELAEYFEIPHTLTAKIKNKSMYAEDLLNESDYSGYLNNHVKRFETFENYLIKNKLPYSFEKNKRNEFDKVIFDTLFPPLIEPKKLMDSNLALSLNMVSDKLSKIGRMISKGGV